MSKSKNCECCLMPLSKDPKESGSEKYCSYCFVNGKLVAEGLTFEEFKKRSYQGMIDGGHNKFAAWFFSNMIRFAPYWKSN